MISNSHCIFSLLACEREMASEPIASLDFFSTLHDKLDVSLTMKTPFKPFFSRRLRFRTGKQSQGLQRLIESFHQLILHTVEIITKKVPTKGPPLKRYEVVEFSRQSWLPNFNSTENNTNTLSSKRDDAAHYTF